MQAIFYDLETSDLNRVGQILNFAFVVVDAKFQVVDTFADRVKVSRLQLPRAGAICANRVDLIEHQELATLSEYEAAHAITGFLNKHASRSKDSPIPLIGYNSESFDLHYLRTVLIRNGINPYFPGLISRDLYLLCQYLLMTSERFRREICKPIPGIKEWMPALRLELVAKQFGLLAGAQSHESLEDVRLTIKLAQLLLHEFDEDIRGFQPYQVKQRHDLDNLPTVLREPLKKEFSVEHYERSFPAVLHDRDRRNALWIRLDRFRAEKESGNFNRSCLSWRKYQEHVTLSGELLFDNDAEMKALALEAREQYRKITLSNYFEPKECYVEQHIYQIGFGEFYAFFRAVNERDLTAKLSREARQLIKRSWLERWKEGDGAEEDFQKSLHDYAMFRYGGSKLILEKYSRGAEEKIVYHPTLKELLSEIELEKNARGAESEHVLTSLSEFYRDSEILRSAGSELLQK